MADLVAERSCELVEPVGALDEPAVHVNESAWQRESVDLPGVDDIELPVQVRPARFPRNGLAQSLDVVADGWIGAVGNCELISSASWRPRATSWSSDKEQAARRKTSVVRAKQRIIS